jgi:SAM-dependent methyltransferase
MSHPQQLFFVGGIKQFLGEFFQQKKVLEIGSLDINGSVRTFFEGCEYVGLDVGEGKGVDLVCYGEDHGAKANEFDVVISCEAMEHNPGWRKTWLNMLRVVKESGLVVMTCASTGRRQHGTVEYTPTDSPLTMEKNQSYYRNLVEDDFKAIIPCDAWFSVWSFYCDHTSHDLYFFGLGKDASPEAVQKATELRAALADYYHKRNVLGLQ